MPDTDQSQTITSVLDQTLIELEASLTNAKTGIDQIDARNALSRHILTKDLYRSLVLAQEAETLAKTEGYDVGLASALKNQSKAHRYAGDYAGALRTAAQAKQLFDELRDRRQQAELLEIMGFIYADLGDYVRGLEAHLAALQSFEAEGHQLLQATSLMHVGMMHSMSGDSARAVEYYRRGIELYSILGETYQQAIAFNSCCVDYARLGDYKRAKEYGETALQMFLQMNDTYGAGVARSSLGEAALASQDYAGAIENFEQALPLLKSRSAELVSVEALETQLNLGRAALAAGDPDRALKYISNVLTHAGQQQMQPFIMQCHQVLSQLHEHQGDLAAALSHLKAYTEAREKILNDARQREIYKLEVLYETQRAQAESERQRKLREQDRMSFERLAQIKDDFLHHTTHDMKNPLAIMNASIFLLQQQLAGCNENAREYIDLINLGIQQIKQLVEDILDLAKLEAAPAIQPDHVAVNQWFDSLLHSFKIMADAKQITLKLEVQPPDLICRCNRQRFARALENLLSNAIKYTPDGGSVQLKTGVVDGWLQIQVIDNGIGIPEEALPRLFDRFYRVSDNHAEGTGLGLSIVKLSVEQHGGSIKVESAIGKGTTFTILLPL